MKQKNKMEIFEIHITGDSEIINFLKEYKLPYLEISLLNKDIKNIGFDCMSAIKYEADNFVKAEEYGRMLYHSISNHANIKLSRLKIETAPLEKYINNALYIERHWEVKLTDTDIVKYPLSFIKNKTKYIATEREYNKNKFIDFARKNSKTELCLLDTNINHDKKWFDIWNKL